MVSISGEYKQKSYKQFTECSNTYFNRFRHPFGMQIVGPSGNVYNVIKTMYYPFKTETCIHYFKRFRKDYFFKETVIRTPEIILSGFQLCHTLVRCRSTSI